MCQCGDEIEHTYRVANKVAFFIYKSRGGGTRIPYDVEFGPLDNAPTSMACGGKQLGVLGEGWAVMGK